MAGPHRRIARELDIHRETVGRICSALAGVQNRPMCPPARRLTRRQNQPFRSPALNRSWIQNRPFRPPGVWPLAGRVCVCRWQAVIEAAVQAGLSAQRIYQDLVGEHQFTGSYHSVKRFVRQLRQTQPIPFVRMEVEPGAEAQVDFGQGAWVLVEGKRKRPHLFRMVLSHSRKGYSEVVWRQTTESFIRCLENAFRYFGGVPSTLVIDNLRAAVTRADWYDPELNPKVAEFCRHYGTVMLPTRPAMPRHKGKIEAGVKYGPEQRAQGPQLRRVWRRKTCFLSDWESGVADTRIHGTTRQQVGKVFNEVERPKLLPLPASLFPVFEEAPRTVHRDGYVELQRAYYSVPPEYVGRQVWARWESRLVRVFNQRREVIAVHALAEPGKFTTDPTHLHSPYRRVIQHESGLSAGSRPADWRAHRQLGRSDDATTRPHRHRASCTACWRWRQNIPSTRWKAPPQKALHHGAWRLRDLRTLLEQAGPSPQLDFLETHPLIRNLDTYRDCVPDCFAPSTINHEPST